MKVRDWKASDIPKLRKIYEASDYKFDFPDPSSPLMEDVFIVEDAEGEPILAGYAVRSVEMIMMIRPGHALVKINAIAKLHEAMRESLAKKGYDQAFAVVGDHLKSYTRHMHKLFGWRKDYALYRIFR